MTKLIALVAAGLFATGTVFAGGHDGCMQKVGNKMTMACEASMADLSLTPEQKEKMDALMAEHHKEGCTEASETKYMQGARKILNKSQYAKFKSECKKASKEKAT